MSDSVERAGRSLNIAILAMGGEGGGVLADWIVDMAQAQGYVAQSTSVPGVAQRTGATIYYVELYKSDKSKQAPVLALMPFPGDVDVVIASELMEAGRAVQRGLVTPERTTLIASTHRVYSMTEKTAMGDGRLEGDKLLASARAVAKDLLSADFAAAAEQHGSVISAVLFGALHASQTLPFERAMFEAAIERGGVGVESSLTAFAAGDRLVALDTGAPPPLDAPGTALGPRLQGLGARIEKHFPEIAQDVLRLGVQRLADYQDIAYAEEYVELLLPIRDLETRSGEGEGLLLRETARHLALWMSYEDTIRVADLKTRRTRFERVAGEVKLQTGQVLEINEFLHPRLEEIADSMPARWGKWLLETPWARKAVQRLTRQGRVVQTSSLGGYLLLYALAALRRVRRKTLRYHAERQRIGAWLARIREVAGRDYDLAVAIAQSQRLVKGYSDTHARGLANFERILALLPSLEGRSGAGEFIRNLCAAALADDTGARLNLALREVEGKA